jgi:hypothetical protein
MVVTIQLAAATPCNDEIEITSEVEVVASASDLAEAVARRARDAALQLVEHAPLLAAPAGGGFVPLSRLLRHVD